MRIVATVAGAWRAHQGQWCERHQDVDECHFSRMSQAHSTSRPEHADAFHL
jgi:hypothetical protein